MGQDYPDVALEDEHAEDDGLPCNKNGLDKLGHVPEEDVEVRGCAIPELLHQQA